MSRIVLTVKEIHSFAGKGMSEYDLKTKLSEDNDYRHSLAKKYAMKHKLHNGATLEFPADGYRNHNLLFWDAQNNEIVEPFSEMDDYGSVPPRFVVGDGYFNPNDWVDEVDHNSFVFPARPLINEMKAFSLEHPNEKKMVVTINDVDYNVSYSPSEMKDKWNACVLEVCDNSITVYPGEPEWRNTIVDDEQEDRPLKELSELEKLKASNLALTKTVEELTAKLIDVTSNVEQLTARLNSV
jgi:hypothetical protein